MTTTELTQSINGDAAHTERGASGRREVFKAMAIAAGATLAGASLLGGRAQAALDPPLKFSDLYEPTYLNLPGLPGGKDIKVLNYALTLEDLESDLYKQAMQRLTIGGKNKLGHSISGLGLSLDEPDVFFINQFASVEAEHRDFLRHSLNGLIDGIAVRPYKYDFGMENKSRADVLDLLITVEDTGAKAYLGAVPYLHSRAFITAAAAIQGTEARHTATLTAIQNVLYPPAAGPKPVAPLASDNNGIEKPIAPDDVLAQVSPFIVK